MSGDTVEQLLGVLPEPMLLVNPSGKVLATNLAMRELWGWTASHSHPVHTSEIFSTPPQRILQYLRLCSGVRQLVPGSFLLRRSSGEMEVRCEGALVSEPMSAERIILLRIKPKLAAVDRFLTLNEQIKVLNREIRERKLAEEALREARDEIADRAEELEKRVQEKTADLRETIAELEMFSYSLSHDMRAPLRAIQSFADIALSDHKEALGNHGAALLSRIISAAARLDRLVQDVLAYSKVAREPIKLERVDLDRIVHEIIEERPELQAPAARVVVSGPLPPVLGHEASLTQCLTNLLDNAAKFVRPGEAPKIQLRSERIDARVRLWIEDQGIGIPSDAQERIFQIFQRHPTGKAYPGSGIGLSIVRKAVERMGGRVGVESETGKGSRFWLELAAPPNIFPATLAADTRSKTGR